MESFNDVFNLALEYCKSKISEVAYGLWITTIEPVGFDGQCVYLFVKTKFKKQVIEEKYMQLLKDAFENVMGFEVDIKISCEETLAEPADDMSRPAAPAPAAPAAEEPRSSGYSGYTPAPGIMSGSMQPMGMMGSMGATSSMTNGNFGGEYEYKFDTFIVGSSNKFAHAASWAVATNPAKAYNPLFIYGDSGLGKTHLVCAICDEVKKNHPNFNVLYVKGEEFTNELITAISKKNTQEFHDKYRAVDMLAVDDIQFIGGKESTQEEFFHTFNTLFQSGKQIVLTSDRPPKEIKTLEDRLRTRFEWGLLADIQPPDFETRVAIIRRKAELLNFTIPDDVSEYIANRLKSNIRQLEGVVKKLKAYKQLAGSNPTILLAQSAIKDILSDHQPLPMTVDRIISEVSRTYSVSADDVKSQKRTGNVSVARQVAMYIIREVTPLSTTAIGEEFGGRDHSTVVYACQQVKKNMEKNVRFRETIEDIIKNIRTN